MKEVTYEEWHFVSKEGFPNKDDIYLIIRSDGLHLGDYCCGGDGDINCQSWCDYPSEEEIQDDSVIAWKEIVLPKEIKANDDGDIIGHDMCEAKAKALAAEMQEKEPDASWEAMNGDGRKATGIKRVSICISGQPEQIEQLKQQAAAANMTVSAYIFQLANITKNNNK